VRHSSASDRAKENPVYWADKAGQLIQVTNVRFWPIADIGASAFDGGFNRSVQHCS